MADGEQELQAIVRAALRPMFRSIWRIRVTGVENIPATGGALLTPNHTSVIDSFFLPAVTPRPVSFVGKAEAQRFRADLLARKTGLAPDEAPEELERPADVVLKSGIGSILMAGATENRIGVLVAAMWGFYEISDDLGESVRDRVSGVIQSVFGTDGASAVIAAGGSIATSVSTCIKWFWIMSRMTPDSSK